MAGESASNIEISRKRLHEILGLSGDASSSELRAAGDRLCAALRARAAEAEADVEAGAEDDPNQSALRLEIQALEGALARYAPGVISPSPGKLREANSRSAKRPSDQISLGAALAGTLFTLLVLIFYSGGFDGVRDEPERVLGLDSPAQLLILGRQGDATLHVLDADRKRVLAESPAQGAILEVKPGRYAIEVQRDGCAEQWTRSVFFESGKTYRFEPTLCPGSGTLALTSNVDDAQTFIDDRPVGATTETKHALSPGEHSIRVEKKGYVSQETKIIVREGETVELHAELEAERTSPPDLETPSPFDFNAPAMAAPAVSKPQPFDLGDLRDSIVPSRKKGGSTRLLERSGLGGLPDGGSTAWHDRVSGEFLGRFDVDASGSIDRIEESDLVGCAYWEETEASFEQGGLGLSMARYYGFDGSEWHDGALGFSRRMRGAAYARMRECGLRS